MKKVLCIGSVTTDVIIKPVDALPTPGELQFIDSSSMFVGGCASNASIDLAKLGVPVSLCVKLGKDLFGRFVYDTCKDAGQGAIATKLEIAGKLSILVLSLPLFQSLLTIVAELLSA